MTIVTHGDAQIIEQIYKHLNKLIDVIKVTDSHDRKPCRTRIGVNQGACGAAKARGDSSDVEIFRGRTVDVSPTTLTIEVTGDDGNSKPQSICSVLRHT